MDRNVKLRPDSGTACYPKRFQQIVRSFIYLTITRPDVSYPVDMISQFMAQPTMEHLQCAQSILWFVNGTMDRGLLYQATVTNPLVGYTDADWAGNASDRRSTSGFAFSLGSVTIAWSSKKQPTVALSSTVEED